MVFREPDKIINAACTIRANNNNKTVDIRIFLLLCVFLQQIPILGTMRCPEIVKFYIVQIGAYETTE